MPRPAGCRASTRTAELAVGLITGSGTHALPGFEPEETRTIATRFGDAEVRLGRFAGEEVVHLSRHGEGHVRLSSSVTHRANVLALKEAGADRVLAVTVCGAVDPTVALGGLLVFDDLHFVVNRLADGSLCTLYPEAGDPERGHWIFECPFSAALRRALLHGAHAAGHDARDGGCYGHVDGPRFNTRAEIRSLGAGGVTAVSQTAGPETVLCGEAELPYALLGYATDYANGVMGKPTPVDELMRLIRQSTGTFAEVLAAAVPLAAAAEPDRSGFVFRF